MAAAVAWLALAACGGGDDGAAGAAALISVAAEAAGSHCANGGSRVDAGTDTNRDGVLAPAEVTSTRYVCDGASGADLNWQRVTSGAVQAESGAAYLADSHARVTITLPAKPAPGDIVKITGVGRGGWKVAQNAGQSVRVGSRNVAWTARGPTNAWVSIARSADGKKLVAAPDWARIHTSTDGGLTWKAQPGSPVQSWTAVASSADGKRLVAVGDGRIYVSADAGATWTARATSETWRAVTMSPDGRTVLASEYGMMGGNLYRSDDYGITWALAGLPFSYWRGLVYSADGGTVVASGDTVQLSTDGGLTWSVLPDAGGELALSADGKKMVTIGGTVDGVFDGRLHMSADAGTSWSLLSQSPYQAAYFSWLAISADGGTQAVAVTDTLMMASTDAGASWQPLASPPGAPLRRLVVSADGNKLIGIQSQGSIYTTQLASTSGVAGYIIGGQHDSVTLQYYGNGLYGVVATEGPLAAH